MLLRLSISMHHTVRSLGDMRCSSTRRFSSSSSSSSWPGAVVGEEQAVAGTEAWIKDYVMDQGLCPFAFKTSYKIVPLCGVSRIDFATEFEQKFVEEVEVLANLIQQKDKQSCDKQFPCTFLVMPNVEIMRGFLDFSRVTASLSRLETPTQKLICEPMDVLYKDSKAPVVLDHFHPDVNGSRAQDWPEWRGKDPRALKYSTRSPWPTLQLLSNSDLRKAWGPDDTISGNIVLKNAATLTAAGTDELDKKLESYRNIKA
ncbi:MAG: hypothetical protein SGARI_001907, partial [Bacillariaceae sp.]